MKLVANNFIFVFIFVISYANFAASWQNSFDLELYDNVLDAEKCQEQLSYIANNDTLLRIQFMDTSFRVPRGLLKGNTMDLGNYFQCLDISQEVLDMEIKGKYCLMNFPLDQDFQLPDLTDPTLPNITWPDWNITWPEWNITLPEESSFSYGPLLKLPMEEFDPRTTIFTEDLRRRMGQFENTKSTLQRLIGTHPEDTTFVRTADGALADTSLRLAICIPKVCTPKQALDHFTRNLTTNMAYTEEFCRLPNDKTWAPVDTVAVVILSVIGLIVILSTAYDVRHTILLEKDPKQANKIYQSFSIYTNTKNFFNFPSSPGIVTCLDGVRSFAMIWVIVGHTYVTQLTFIPENPLDMVEYIQTFRALWVTSGTITVDTFFTIGGLLVVYTTANKISRMSLLKNLHLFYLNRLLRMFPVLAFGILLTASFLHRTVDGPYFIEVTRMVNNCRSHWWSTLLYVQNFVNPSNMCLAHGWYLAIDMQLFFLSPIVLFFVLGQRKRTAWLALVTALLAVVTGGIIYNFLNNFPSAVVALSRLEDSTEYLVGYYVHTLPRAGPFFVGLIFGYLLHIHRTKKPRIPMPVVLLFWVLALAGTSLVCMVTYWNIQPDWDNQTMDNVFNSFIRPVWATSIGWLVFACHTGYGGPVNWILSLHVFKILARLSYAMYILHYPMIFLLNATALSPIYFAIHFSMYRFFVDFTLAVVAAFIATIIIDYPFTNLIKMAMGGGARKRPQQEKPASKDEPEAKLDSIDVYGNEKKTKL